MKKTPKQVDLRITTTELEFYDKVSRAIGKDIKGDTYVGSMGVHVTLTAYYNIHLRTK